jgi:CheY-like chemotaxis protein
MAQEAGRILVVDDDLDALVMVQKALESEGYAVQPALDGIDALIQVERRFLGHIALILTDLRMPMQHGWEFIRSFRDQWGDEVPIVVMTGADDPVPAELKHDVAAVLHKPFDIDNLLATVARYYGKQRDPLPAP